MTPNSTIALTTTTLLIMGLLTFFGCSKQLTPQKVSMPSAADMERLAKQRVVIEWFLADDASRTKFTTAAGKLGTLRALLDQKRFAPTQTYELQCMGVVLGDAFVSRVGHGVGHGRGRARYDPALRMPGTSIIIYPLTMISKRIERGETVDVFDLFNGVADQINQLKKTVR